MISLGELIYLGGLLTAFLFTLRLMSHDERQGTATALSGGGGDRKGAGKIQADKGHNQQYI